MCNLLAFAYLMVALFEKTIEKPNCPDIHIGEISQLGKNTIANKITIQQLMSITILWMKISVSFLGLRRKNKSKEYTTSLQLNTDGEYKTDTDDDKNPESNDDENLESESSSQNHVANEAVDFEKYLLLKKPLWNTFGNAGTSH
ncbi:hypothetical protein RhiirA4_482633 [Rhizophagus irregularis]|uniref:Uncharacterized protein n=1 Tax=Rhizophagus irregularis TaxID=588596 RepID=A0A2I1HLB9_9GLOM|nr:hypothetical protein RhiirA4_482633 [Rhizophagus irregularis]